MCSACKPYMSEGLQGLPWPPMTRALAVATCCATTAGATTSTTGAGASTTCRTAAGRRALVEFMLQQGQLCSSEALGLWAVAGSRQASLWCSGEGGGDKVSSCSHCGFL